MPEVSEAYSESARCGSAADPVERSAAVLWNTGINRSTDTFQLTDNCIRIARLGIIR